MHNSNKFFLNIVRQCGSTEILNNIVAVRLCLWWSRGWEIGLSDEEKFSCIVSLLCNWQRLQKQNSSPASDCSCRWCRLFALAIVGLCFFRIARVFNAIFTNSIRTNAVNVLYKSYGDKSFLHLFLCLMCFVLRSLFCLYIMLWK